jgi:hypothetical protein
MSSFADKVLGFDPPKPKLPAVTSPAPIPEKETDQYTMMKRQRKRQGRADTILTGDLVPEPVGRTALG